MPRPETASSSATTAAPGTPAARAAAPAAPRAHGKPASRNPLFPVGASLYPLDRETDGAEDWYARDIAADLDLMAAARCALVRLFVSWRVLEPQVGQYSEQALDRLSEIVEAARERKMQAIVCFFADDRHAELSDVSWGKKRDPRTDSYLLQREAALVAKVVSRLANERGVFGWQLGNEAFLSGFESAEELEAWVTSLRDSVREHDARRPVALGADAETLFRSSGVDARAAVQCCEFAVAHTTAAYRAYAAEGPLDFGPSTYLEPFLLRLAHRGSPVMLDELGSLSLEYSAGEEAASLRVALWSGLCNRAAGAMVRRLRDMETERREPYFLDPFETLIGVVDDEGETKPAYDELSTFVRTAAHIDLKTYSLIAERTAILIPDERYEPLPNLAGLFGPRASLQAFVAAKRAQLPVTVARETDDFGDYQVIVVPSAFKLAEETWVRLSAFAQRGGTLLLSYGGGDAPSALGELFGMEFLGDGGPATTLTCRVAQLEVMGALESFDADFDVPNYALLSGGTATVVATDANGNPLVTVNQVGQGRAVFVSVPIERAIAQGDPWATPSAVAKMVREIYGAVARGAGCGAPVSCDCPNVELGLFQGESDDVLVLVNHSAEKVSVNLVAERRIGFITDVRGGAPVAVGGMGFGVPLAASGVAALRLTYA